MARKPRNVVRVDAAAHPTTVFRADGFVNGLVGIGQLGTDKRLGGTGANLTARFTVPVLGREEAVMLWRANDMAARIIEDGPNEMARPGWNVLIAEDPEAAEAMDALHDELQLAEVFSAAEKRARAEGGSLIVLGVNDGQAPDQPLNMDGIRTFDWLNVVGPDEIGVWQRYEDPTQASYGKPLLYQVKPNPQRDGRIPPNVYLHESRVLRFDGVQVSGSKWQSSNLLDGWGDSVLLRVYHVLRDFEMSWSAAAILMQEFSQGVFKFKNLAELMAGDQDQAVVARMRMASLSKSITNSLIMDSEETFERVGVPLAGVPEVLQQFAIRLSAAADMPVTRLMGQSPAGLNATGESDVRGWFDRVDAHRNRSWRPKLNKVCQCLFRMRGGPTNGKEPENWMIRFGPLWQMTAKESAEVRFIMAQADEKNIANNVVTPEEVARSRFGGDDFSTDTALDVDTRTKLAEALEASENEKDQDTALNGAQVASLLEIVTKVAEGKIPRESGIAMLTAAFPVDEKEAEAIMGTAGMGFVPTAAPAPATVQTPAPGTTRPRETVNAAEP